MPEIQKFYLTKEGLGKIKKEYEDLKRLRLAKTTGEAPKILESEDLNPEYLSFQEDLSFLESRIGELECILKNALPIKHPKGPKQEVIGLGARVTVEVNSQTDEFTIVGSLEADPGLGKISNESLVGQTLLGRRVGEEVIISSPTKTTYKIKKIRYFS
jgi:transcription elongation factor GreA